MNKRNWLQAVAAGATLLALTGCASMHQLSADVSTFGSWPAGRAPGTYAFERLPSQQAQADTMQQLEDAARPALARAGFQPVATGGTPDVLVQVGVRVSRADRSPWDDPLWWHGGFGMWRPGPWRGPMWSTTLRMDSPRYDREVAVLVRDRSTGAPLFEARASSEGFQRSTDGAALQPLFTAALMDFPATGVNPRQVQVPISR
jgi:hypothetical protein